MRAAKVRTPFYSALDPFRFDIRSLAEPARAMARQNWVPRQYADEDSCNAGMHCVGGDGGDNNTGNEGQSKAALKVAKKDSS